MRKRIKDFRVTMGWLEEEDACVRGTKWFMNKWKKVKPSTVIASLVVRKGHSSYGWADWLVDMLEEEKIITPMEWQRYSSVFWECNGGYRDSCKAQMGEAIKILKKKGL